MRRGIPLSQDSRATRNEFGKRMAASKLDRCRSEQTAARSELHMRGIIASTSGTSFHIGAIFAGAAIIMRASGRPFLIARTAGTLITASPSQLLERIKIRHVFKSLVERLDGK